MPFFGLARLNLLTYYNPCEDVVRGKQMIRATALVAALPVLAACGGADGGPVQTGPIAQAATDTTLSVFDGQLLPARVTTLREEQTIYEVRRVPTDTAIGYDTATQELVLKVGANTRTLDLSGNDPEITLTEFWAERGTGPDWVIVTVVGDTLNAYKAGLAGAEYAIPFSAYLLDSSGLFIDRSYGVAGLETPTGYLRRTQKSARYTGNFEIEAYRNFDPSGESRHILNGDVSVRVNFSENMISGGTLTLTNEVVGTGSGQTRTGTVAIGSATINEPNGFSASLTSNAAGLTLDDGAALSGAFYGNTAQNMGGSIAFTGALDGRDVLAGGAFIAVEE